MPNGSKAQILVVDDEPSIRESLGMLLTSVGYDVALAENGVSAVSHLDQRVPDLIVTDLNMPNMDGIQMIAAIRKLPGYPFTPILMLTTESQAEKKDEGRKAGATGWIVKPFDGEKLIAAVQKLVK